MFIVIIISDRSNLPHPTTISLPRPSSKSKNLKEKRKESNRMDLQREERTGMMGEFWN